MVPTEPGSSLTEPGRTRERPAESLRPFGRLRRCRCCTEPWKAAHYFVYLLSTPGVVFGEWKSPAQAFRALPDFVFRAWSDGISGAVEIERVAVFKNGGTWYEVVRGNKWVDSWQGRYGRHAPAGRSGDEVLQP